MGHEYVELRNAAAAVHCYREAVKFQPGYHSSDYRAWYGLGQAYEMLHLYAYALHYYQKATVLRPVLSAVATILFRLLFLISWALCRMTHVCGALWASAFLD